MKLITKGVYAELYEFDKIRFSSEPNCGLILCYHMTHMLQDIMTNLKLESKFFINGNPKWCRIHSYKSLFDLCPSVDVFCAIYNTSDFGAWQLTISYGESSLVIDGKADSILVTVICETGIPDNTHRLFSAFESHINAYLETLE